MEQEDIKVAIIERFNSLQPQIQEIIINTNYEQILYGIAKEYNLTDDQYKDLELNTTLVLLGNTHPDEYKSEIMEDLKISEENTNLLINEINNKILNNVLPILRQNFVDDEKLEQKYNPENNPKNILYSIGQKYNLPIDVIGEIDTSTNKFLSGKITSVEYEKNLNSILDKNPDKKSEIIKEINEQIILKRRENMMEGNPTKDNVVPLPPYKKTKGEGGVPLPPQKIELIQQDNDENNLFDIDELERQEREEKNKKNLVQTNTNIFQPSTDIYREQPPKTTSNVVILPQKEEFESVITEDTKKEVPSTNTNPNIISDKLFNKTTSHSTVVDYSLPKLNLLNLTPESRLKGDAPTNSHDPYREVL